MGTPAQQYEQRYKQAQWEAHKWHRQHNEVSKRDERNSGSALRRARQFLPESVYLARRRETRRANSMRHLKPLRLPRNEDLQDNSFAESDIMYPPAGTRKVWRPVLGAKATLSEAAPSTLRAEA